MSCSNANDIGNSNENNAKKKKRENLQLVEFTIGCFTSKVMIFKVKELNRK